MEGFFFIFAFFQQSGVSLTSSFPMAEPSSFFQPFKLQESFGNDKRACLTLHLFS
jgi:hypothetical protein